MNDQKPDRLMPALAGGAFLGVASAIPYLGAVNCACCALVIGGGFLSVFIFKRKSPDTVMTYGDGALQGLLSGLIGSVICSLLNALLSGVTGGGARFAEVIEQVISSNPDLPPEVVELLRNISNSGAAGLGFVFIGFLFLLVISAIFGTVGGVLGVAILQKKPPQAPPPQWSQPQPPGSYQPPQPPPYQPPPTQPPSGGDVE